MRPDFEGAELTEKDIPQLVAYIEHLEEQIERVDNVAACALLPLPESHHRGMLDSIMEITAKLVQKWQ